MITLYNAIYGALELDPQIVEGLWIDYDNQNFHASFTDNGGRKILSGFDVAPLFVMNELEETKKLQKAIKHIADYWQDEFKQQPYDSNYHAMNSIHNYI